jgi:hypothetical protein
MCFHPIDIVKWALERELCLQGPRNGVGAKQPYSQQWHQVAT